MEKNKDGFTLIELLAVIVILGVILVVAGTSVFGSKRKANIDEAKTIEKTLSDLGAGIYSYEIILGDKTSDSGFYKLYKSNSEFIVTLEMLKESGYLKDLTSDNKISNPFGGADCNGYLLVKQSSNGPEFKGYINCGKNNYRTNDWEEPSTYSNKATLTKIQ